MSDMKVVAINLNDTLSSVISSNNVTDPNLSYSIIIQDKSHMIRIWFNLVTIVLEETNLKQDCIIFQVSLF